MWIELQTLVNILAYVPLIGHKHLSTWHHLMWQKHRSSLGGLEPPTFRLTAERANRLRHRDSTHAWRQCIDLISDYQKHIDQLWQAMLHRSINTITYVQYSKSTVVMILVTFYHLYQCIGVGGVTVSMVAFQAVDPGSTPGRRTCPFCQRALAGRDMLNQTHHRWMPFPTWSPVCYLRKTSSHTGNRTRAAGVKGRNPNH